MNNKIKAIYYLKLKGFVPFNDGCAFDAYATAAYKHFYICNIISIDNTLLKLIKEQSYE